MSFPALTLTAALLVVDGDTVKLDGQRMRLIGIDAPETGHRAQCLEEQVAASRASARLSSIVAAGVEIEYSGRSDRWGRPLVNLRLPDGRLAGDVLVDEGLARIWAGRRENWCGG